MSQPVDPAEVSAAITELYGPLERQGPGDTGFSLKILGGLPPLPAAPRIADLGCGAGAGELLEGEIDLLRRFSGHYGYSFYVLTLA